MTGGSEVSEQKKNKGGRPSKYNPEIQKLADDYVDSHGLYNEVTGSDGKKIMMVNSIPSVAGLALELKISRETVYQWGKTYSQFSDTLERLNSKQQQFLLHHGLTKNYDSSFAKFISVNLTNWRDKVEQTVDQKTVQINIDKEDNEL